MSPAAAIRVGLVAPQEIVRIGVRALLGQAADLQVAWEADGIVDGVPAPPADVVVCVGDLPVPVLLGGVRRWRRTGAQVVVLREDWPSSLFPALMEAGVRAYLTPDLPGARLTDAVRAVHGDGLVIGSPAVRGPRRAGAADAADPVARLSPTELRILELLAQGLTNRAVAGVLFLSEKTVKNYVSRILAKLGARRRTEAVSQFVRYERVHRG